MSESSNNVNSPEVEAKISSNKIIDNLSQRKDCFGNIISRKTKKHKICFRDNLEERKDIAEIHLVTSFKTFYERCKFFINLALIDDAWSCRVI